MPPDFFCVMLHPSRSGHRQLMSDAVPGDDRPFVINNYPLGFVVVPPDKLSGK